LKTITSSENSRVKHWIKLRKDRKYRAEKNCFLLMGQKVLQECSCKVKTLILSEGMEVSGVECDESVFVSEKVMKKLTGLEAPEGVVGEMEMPPQGVLEGMNRVLVFDGVSDPGNFGTLLRTAIAFGWEGVFVLESSVDPFNDKALRAAKGATLQLPMVRGSVSDLKILLSQQGALPLVGDLSGMKPEEIDHTGPLFLVLSNESQGPSNELKVLCQPVSIPMSGKMESLNVGVAGGILMYLLRRENR